MGQWGQWSKCSLDCVNVSMNQTYVFPNKIRTRKILRKSNAKGQSCDQFESRDIKTCNMRPCPINGQWKEWSNFSSCSASCGNGTKSRTRICEGPFYGGLSCPESELSKESVPCRNGQNWPCILTSWSNWTSCTKVCGLGGTKNRTRQIVQGQNCPSLIEEMSCFDRLCSNEVYKLESIKVQLSNVAHSGSDNSWRIRLWNGENILCMTEWLDRYSVTFYQPCNLMR